LFFWRSVGAGDPPVGLACAVSQEEKNMNLRRAILSFATLCCLAACAFLIVTPAKADDVYASIRGTVTDQSGAVLPDVNLTATNVATRVVRTTVTSKDGTYQFLQLQIGTYILRAEKSGFAAFTTTQFHLDVDQIYVQNIKLGLGAVSQEVTVQANAVQVESTSMQLGDVVTGQEIVDAPLVNRNYTQLQQLEPGVVSASDRFGTTGTQSDFATNGSETQQNSFLINGMDSSDISLNTALVIPSPDALSEFRLVTSTINPEYGRNSGAILSAAIKSGTDQFHGDVFEFFRDTSLNGRNYFQNKPSVFHQNLFGGTIGGPIWKQHTFFFFSYQGSRFAQPQAYNGNGNLPIDPRSAEAGGDFTASSVLLSTSKGTSPIPLVGDNGTTYPAGTPYSTIFSGNMIPTADFNTVAAKLASAYVPAPNVPNQPGAFSFQPTEAGKTDQYLFRIDHTFNAHDSIWEYSFFESDPRNDTLSVFGGTLPGFGETQQQHVKEFVGAWQHIFGANTLNELRLGYQRLNFVAIEPQKAALPGSFGFSGITPQDPGQASLPLITVSGADVNFSFGFSQFGPQPRIDETYQAGDNFSHVYGNHTIKFGYEGRRFEVHNPFFTQNNGSFTFGGTGAFSTGNPFADYLLGFPDSYVQSSGNIIDARSYEHYAYVQDQFKIKPNLTFTYGIGWDINTPLSNLTNAGLAINCFTALRQSTVFPTAPAGLLFPGDAGCSSSGYRTHYNDFGPRAGLAWSPDWGWISGGPGKLSIRAGYGIYYNRGEEELTLQFLTDPPFGLTDGGVADAGGVPSFVAPFTDVRCLDQTGNPLSCSPVSPTTGKATPASIANKYPFSAPRPGSAVDFTAFEPFGLATIDPNFRAPYAENYNLTIERELPAQAILTLAYVGSMGHRLETWFERNPGLPGQCAAVKACISHPFTEYQAPYNLPPFHQYDSTVFGSIGTEASFGNSNYNAFQASLNKHLSHGLSLLASYTYSHGLDNSSSFEDHAFNGLGMDPFNFKRYYGDSAYDARQRLVLDYSYIIPAIPGTEHGLVNTLVNGWRISGITTFQKGFPVTVFNNVAGILGTSSGTCPGNPVLTVFVSCWDTVNVVAPVTQENPRATGNFWFSPASFAAAVPPSLGGGTPFNPETGGNAGRNFFHGPGLQEWDFQLSKDFQIRESLRMEFRAELYNIFNHTNFNNPDGNFADGPAFGSIGAIQGLPREVQLAAKFYF
jgi:hypothetical protein